MIAAAYSIVVGDFTGNGKADIVAAEQSGSAIALIGHGDGTFEEELPILTGADPTLVETADLNGDGMPDFVVIGGALTTVLNDWVAISCDVNPDGTVDVGDVQTMVNEALGIARPLNDLNADGVVNVVDVQIDIDAALNLGCEASQSNSPSNANAKPAGGR